MTFLLAAQTKLVLDPIPPIGAVVVLSVLLVTATIAIYRQTGASLNRTRSMTLLIFRLLGVIARPPHSPTPVRVLTASGAAGAEAISLQWLLGGGIPDVPITVDAQLPAEPENSLRERMRVTKAEYCSTRHKKTDPLGLPFEMYNHAGLFRTTELGKPVDTTGEIIDSGDQKLDGPVASALEMIVKLANSERVEQVFVRHAFHFSMGRNETLNDAPVLQAAHAAYRDNGGSMKALITSLLTSDAFLYRKVERETKTTASQGK